MARRGEPFFLLTGILVAGVVIAGFGLNFLWEGQALPPAFTPLIVLHGLVMLAWFLLFVVQARLIAQGGVKLHMRLGTASAALAAAVVISGLIVMVGAYRRGVAMDRSADAAFIVAFNLVNLAQFSLFYCLGYLRRFRASSHKRLMLLAGVAMLPPAAGRLVLSLGLVDVSGLLIFLAFLAALIVHDRRTLGRVQPETRLGTILILGGIVFGLVVGTTEAWSELVRSLLA